MFSFQPDAFPTTPGVYLMKDAAGKIIYVGKAKKLRKRLSSYFRPPDQLAVKTRSMMSRVERIDTLQTGSEKEALLLEASLIKKHRPKYNIVLRDDKQYLLFRLDKRSEFPRLTITRHVVRDGSVYFGPFTSASAARQTLKAVNRIFPLRTCNDHVFKNRVRPCLQYDIRRCPGPCVYPVSSEEYAKVVRKAELFLSGRSRELLYQLRQEMLTASETLAFERAAYLRDLIQSIEKTVEPQATVLAGDKNLDVIALVEDEKGLAVSMIFVRRGKVLDGKNFFWKGVCLEAGEESRVLHSFLSQFYGPEKFVPERILLPCDIDDPALEELLADFRQGPVRIAKARGGVGRRLVDIAVANGQEYIRTNHLKAVALRLGKALGLAKEPERIECIDASHLSGQGMCVGMVVFEKGRPQKKDYRIYSFPEMEGEGDDYRALAGFLVRRLAAGPPWPDLMLVDGGKGQLRALERVFEQEGMVGLFPIACIAKGESRRAGELGDRIFVPGRKNALSLRRGGRELLFLQMLRDNAHRFVISRQRHSRKKKAFNNFLESIPGVGPKMGRILWEHFKSLAAMREATEDDFQALSGIGKKKAAVLVKALTMSRH